MPSRIAFSLLLPVVLVLTVGPAQQADAQGLLKRLRDRLAPRLQSRPPEQSPRTRLPARPLPGPTDPAGTGEERAEGAARWPAGPAARYRAPLGLRPLLPQPGQDGASGENAAPQSRRYQSPLRPLATDQPRASIGIQGVSANPGYPAVQVTEIRPESQADEAGLRPGDYIFAIDSVPTPTVGRLAFEVGQREPDESVRLRLGRAGRVFDLDVPLIAGSSNPATEPDARPEMLSQPSNSRRQRLEPIGPSTNETRQSRTQRPAPLPPGGPLTVAPRQDSTAEKSAAGPADRSTARQAARLGAQLEEAGRRRGVSVQAVASGSPAEKAGLAVDDRIVSVDGRVVTDRARLSELLSRIDEGENAEFQVIRDEQLMGVSVELTQVTAASRQADSDSAAPGSASSAQTTTRGGTATTESSMMGGLGQLFGGVFGNRAAGADTAQKPASPKTSPPVSKTTQNPSAPGPATPVKESSPNKPVSEPADDSAEVLPPPSLPALGDVLALEPPSDAEASDAEASDAEASDAEASDGETRAEAADDAADASETQGGEDAQALQAEVQRLRAQLKALQQQLQPSGGAASEATD